MSEQDEARKKRMEVMRLELQISKSTTVKMELELQIAKSEDEIQRMREHQKLQDQAIADAKSELAKIKEG